MARIDLVERAELIVGGESKTVLQISSTHGVDNPASSLNATIRHDQGGFTGTEAVAGRLGYRSYSSMGPIFGGAIDTDSIRWAQKSVSFTAVDQLRRLMEPTGIEDLSLVNTDPELPPTNERYAYGAFNKSDGQIVTELCALVGVTDVVIEDTGTLFATLAPSAASRWAVRLPSDQAPWALIEEIDTITGCVTFGGPDGRLWRVASSGLPAGFVARTFAEYADIGDGASRERGSSQQVINKVTVVGQSGIDGDGVPYAISASRTKISPYVPTPPGTREYTFQSDLIETEEIAGTCAEYLLAKKGRRTDTFTIPLVKGDATLRAGITVALDAPNTLEVTPTMLCRVVRVNHRFPPYKTTLTLEGSFGSEGTDPNQKPILSIGYTIVLNHLANGDTIAVVRLTSAGSVDPDGSIVLRTWTGDPTDPTPIGDGVEAVVVYNPLDADDPPTVTLTAQDDQGKVASATVPIIATPGNTYTRELWVADGTTLSHTVDEITWDEFDTPAVVIPEQAGDEYTLAAGADGTVNRVLADGTATAIPELTDTSALTISRDANGKETGVAWAGATDGRIGRSTDYGQTFVAVAPLPNGGRCNAIQESPYASGDVYAGGGHILYHSYGAGASWQPFYTNPDDTLLITRLASGIAASEGGDPADDRPVMWIAYTSAGAGGHAHRVVERGGTLEHTLPTGQGDPLDVVGLTISLDATRLFALDTGGDNGRAWVAPSLAGGDLTWRDNYDGVGVLGSPRHAIRDGIAPIVWGASAGAVWKTTDEGIGFYVIREVGAHMIGYGRLLLAVTPTAHGDLIWIGAVRNRAIGNVWVYTLADAGFSRAAHPITALGLVANQNVALLKADSGVLFSYGHSGEILGLGRGPSHADASWRSTDGGATWEALDTVSNVYAMAVGGGIAYAAGFKVLADGFQGSNLWRSDDDGATWALVDDIGVSATIVSMYNALAVDPNDGMRVAIKGVLHIGPNHDSGAGPGESFHLSEDGGATWAYTGYNAADQSNLARGEGLAFSPDGARLVWFSQDSTPHYARNGGLPTGSLSTATTALQDSDGIPFAHAPGVVYAYGASGVQASADGQLWTALYDTGRAPNSVAVDTRSFVPGDAENDWYALPGTNSSTTALARRAAAADAGNAWEDLTSLLSSAFPDLQFWAYREAAVRLEGA